MSDVRLYKTVPLTATRVSLNRVRPNRVSPQNLEVSDGNSKTPTPLPPRPGVVRAKKPL
tara:strand:- start:1330 stop:1506 length:177 start_codon:yes stop_codon:yes gene_type:complete